MPSNFCSIYVIDLGSAHGTFVANERLIKDTPVELEAGQSLRFAASTRTYILRKNNAALFSRPPPPSEINLLLPPDPYDEEAVVAYNTLLNQYNLKWPNLPSESSESGSSANQNSERPAKRIKKERVSFTDQVGGELIQVVGFSDGADVETEPGPIGVKEGSLVGKYESLVQTMVIPKGKEQQSVKENSPAAQKGVTNRLQEVLNKVKAVPKSGKYDDLYGESLAAKVGSSWAHSSEPASPTKGSQGKTGSAPSAKPGNDLSYYNDNDEDDLFGD
uniref:FHA domain-containing protein n=1 Tax=Rhizophora mucronata TaxID=61149 RepID=A0A2P2J8E0_RHIMU